MKPEAQMKKLAYSLVILLLAISLTACGFKLRGSGGDTKIANLPASIYIAGVEPYSDLDREIQRRIKGSGSTIATAAAGSDALLSISSRISDKRSMAVNRTNDDAEFELTEGYKFALRAPGKGELVPSQTVRVTRILYAPDSETLSGSNEEKQLRKEMIRQLVDQMMRRISIRLR